MSAPKARPGMLGMAWQLAQTLWVGGLWMLHFVLLPALDRFGLAPMLIDEIARFMRPLLVVFAVVCALLQLLLLAVARRRAFWADLRSGLLLLVLLAAGVFFVAGRLPAAEYWQLFCYLILALAGLLLVLQARPDEAGR